MSVPLIRVDHKLVEVGVVFDDAQRNHICDIGVCVPQLVQFQVDFEQIFPDSVRAGLQTTTHYVSEGEVSQFQRIVILSMLTYFTQKCQIDIWG